MDVADDTVIVEFGSNKSSRIPSEKNFNRSGRESGSVREGSQLKEKKNSIVSFFFCMKLQG